MKTVLNVNTPLIEVRRQDETANLPFALSDIGRLLAPFPPHETAWEGSIMLIEDGIAPLAGRFDSGEVCLEGTSDLTVLPHTEAAAGSIISADTLETAFAVLAGYRLSRDLPPLPHTTGFAALVLLLREWTHHLHCTQITVGNGN